MTDSAASKTTRQSFDVRAASPTSDGQIFAAPREPAKPQPKA